MTDTEKAILERLSKLDKLDEIVKKLDVIDQKVTNVAINRSARSNLDTRQLATETKVQGIETTVNEMKNRLDQAARNQERMMAAIRNAEIQGIKREENGRKYNVVINNIPQLDVNEDRKVSVEHVRKVISDVLKIRGGKNIIIKNAHRIPSSQPVKPIIFKVNTMCDKQLIWDHLSNLNTYNEAQQSDRSKVFIDMNNLPAKLNRDKKSLLEKFKELKRQDKKPKWHYDKNAGECYIKCGGQKFKSKTDNFDFKFEELVQADVLTGPWKIIPTFDEEHSEYE